MNQSNFKVDFNPVSIYIIDRFQYVQEGTWQPEY